MRAGSSPGLSTGSSAGSSTNTNDMTLLDAIITLDEQAIEYFNTGFTEDRNEEDNINVAESARKKKKQSFYKKTNR